MKLLRRIPTYEDDGWSYIDIYEDSDSIVVRRVIPLSEEDGYDESFSLEAWGTMLEDVIKTQLLRLVKDGNPIRLDCHIKPDDNVTFMLSYLEDGSVAQQKEMLAQMKHFQALINFRQQQRGGRPKGMSDRTKREYLRIAEEFWKLQNDSGYTEFEYCLDKGISERKLQRAIGYAMKQKRQ